LNARQRADGQLIAIDRPFQGTQLGGDLQLIDAANFVEICQGTTPATQNEVCTAQTGFGQTEATTLGVTTDANLPSAGGRFASAYPLYDGTNRMLVSWSPCLVLDTTVKPPTSVVCTASNTTGPNVQMAPPEYTLWIYDFGAGTLSPLLSAEPGTEIVEPVILQARTPAPTFIPDWTPCSISTTCTQQQQTAQQNLVTNQVGVLDISSVYDFDGIDTAKPNIATQADPANAGFSTRPARFIRIEKAVEIPSKKVRKIDQAVYGPAGMGMREILGYAPIQPDGSVQIQVPANVPFTVDILDANARRITAQHTSWLQLLPGETKSCNGCHTVNPADPSSHGRSGLTLPVNAGALTTGAPFKGTNPALFANAGETMAQTLARISCDPGSAIPCSQILSTDVIYTTLWTTGVTLPAGMVDTGISYLYANLTTPAPVTPLLNPSCFPWSAVCRITIHYANAQATTAQPLPYLQTVWNASPRTATVKGVANTSVTCTLCHNTVSAANVIQVPAGQLDLTDGASTADPTIVTSYEDLLFSSDEQTLNMGVLEELLEPPPGDPTGTPVPVMLAAPMSAGDAGASTQFLRMFDGSFHDPVLDHTGFLTPAELRLISEWLDIGGQYYNDPFVAPVAN
jgi:hypothetical protein